MRWFPFDAFVFGLYAWLKVIAFLATFAAIGG